MYCHVVEHGTMQFVLASVFEKVGRGSWLLECLLCSGHGEQCDNCTMLRTLC